MSFNCIISYISISAISLVKQILVQGYILVRTKNKFTLFFIEHRWNKPFISDVQPRKSEQKCFIFILTVCFNISCDISPRNNTHVEVKRQQNLRSSTDNISVWAERLDERLKRHFLSNGSYLTTQTGFYELLSSRRAYRINFLSHLLMICTDGLDFFPRWVLFAYFILFWMTFMEHHGYHMCNHCVMKESLWMLTSHFILGVVFNKFQLNEFLNTINGNIWLIVLYIK